MEKKTDTVQNPNTPENWDRRWKNIGLVQTDDVWVQHRLKKVAQLVPDQATVIDLAAGPGLIRYNLPQCPRYTPVDFSPEALKLLGGHGIVATCTDVPVPPHSYHTVLAMEILEHLDDPYPLITEALRIARFQIIVTVPDDRLPPEEFPYHRRTWDQGHLSDFLRTFPGIAFTAFFQVPANIIAQSILKSKDPRP